jgi:hypothetical protein
MDGWTTRGMDETERTERVASASASAPAPASASFFSFAPVAVVVVVAANHARLVKRNRRHGHPSIDTPRDTTRASTHEWVSTTDEGWDGDVV